MTDLQEATATPRLVGEVARTRLLAGLPVHERHLDLAGVSTAVLEGGDGPPLVLLHGPFEYAAKWRWILPDLVTTHRVIAPDLPGHGSSVVSNGSLDPGHVLAWLAELIDRTCLAPPTVVGHLMGGAIAARFTVDHGARLERLVLVDSLGLRPLEPAPEFGQALNDYLAMPTEETHDALWQRCAFDLDAVRDRMGHVWEPFAAYNLALARAAAGHPAPRSLLEHFGFPAIPPDALAAITVPTTLIWGRHDLATPLSVAEDASARYGWPLHVVEAAADDPAIEQPDGFLRALRATLDG